MPGDQQDNQQNQQQAQSQPIEFGEWLKGQSEEIRAAYEQHTSGLKSALQSERQQRGDLEKQLREAANKAEKGSEAQQQLTEMADKLAALEGQQDFYDQAHKLGVSDLKLAYLAAREAGLIDGKGRANFDELKKLHPNLFSATQPAPGHAGTGTGKQPTGGGGMNDFIRKAAGKG